jgi:uncharacterized protein (DUF697 family)
MTQENATPEAPSAEDRRFMAQKLVKRFSFWSGAAGTIPLPFVDMATVGGVQMQMLRRLTQVYDVPFSENRGKSMLAMMAGMMIPATSGMGVISIIKGVPVAGTVVSALAMPTLSAGATYAIGIAFIEHFASGGTLLGFAPPDYRAKAEKEGHH